MAGHADKKQAKKAETHSWYYLYAILVVNIVYVLFRIVLGFGGGFGFWNKLGAALFWAVSYVTYGGIKSALAMGMDFEIYLDVFAVNLCSQLLVAFTNKGWLLYLTVPGYILYKIVRWGLDWVFTPRADELDANDPRAKKRAEKKARQAERPKFKTYRS